MSKKIRLDVLLTERGLCESRQKAQTTIMAGLVFVDGQRTDSAQTSPAHRWRRTPTWRCAATRCGM